MEKRGGREGGDGRRPLWAAPKGFPGGCDPRIQTRNRSGGGGGDWLQSLVRAVGPGILSDRMRL